MADPTTSVSRASFRDPAGYVYQENGVIKRAVTLHGSADYEKFVSSGLYKRLVDESLLVAHEEAPPSDSGRKDIHKVLIPERIRFISYPYEWSFGQLRDAALVTLRVQKIALEFGMSLKDASGFNVQFRGSQPIFIDTLSFEENDGGPWPAYSQFCRHFLAVLLLMARVNPYLGRFLTSSIDGIPLDLASSLLPRSSYLNFGTLVHIHLHNRSQRKYASANSASAAATVLKLDGPDRKPVLVESLESAVEGIKFRDGGTEWADYYKLSRHYSGEAVQAKKEFVVAAIARVDPKLVYDLGGNIGEYSRLATAVGIDTVCFDIDPLCVHRNYEQSKAASDRYMLPLLTDLSNPSPSLGFALAERFSFLERAKPDLVLALALIHHLRITYNIPLSMLAEFFAGLGRHLVIEFVPKSDVMTQALLKSREDTFFDYDKDGFLASFQRYFVIKAEVPVAGTDRILYLLEGTV